MKNLIFIAAMAMGFAAHADGFKCETESGLVVQVYNHTQPEVGTRTGAVMVISDSKISWGNKTIAKFTDLQQTLSSKELTFVGKVDLRFSNLNRKGELLAGTKLGYVDQVALTVAFTYASPTAYGAEMPASLHILKRDGSLITDGAVCQRYLKN